MPRGLGIMGQKVGMAQVFDSEGRAIGATVVSAPPCTVMKVKDSGGDGYPAVQVAFGADEKAAKRVNKPQAGQFAKLGIPVHRFAAEFRPKFNSGFPDEPKLEKGAKITVAIFKKGDRVDVQGISKGHGFQGVVKRHGFQGGPATHGSMQHRAPGSVGASTDPGRTFRGTRMAGRHGNHTSTSQNLEVLEVDAERDLLVLKGAVPGAPGSLIRVTPTVKTRVPSARRLFVELKAEPGKTASKAKAAPKAATKAATKAAPK